MDSSEKGSTFKLDPEMNQNLLGLQSCGFLSTLISLPWINSCTAHLLILRLDAVGDCMQFMINAHIGETF